MGGYDDDDSTGKHKVSDVRSRSAVLSAVLIVGVCLGVLTSEKLYLLAQESDMPEGAVAAARTRKLEVSSKALAGGQALAAGGGAGGMRRMGGKPRNQLEELLRKVAPSGEVMIAISNINLIHESSLTMWLEVGAAWFHSRRHPAWVRKMWVLVGAAWQAQRGCLWIRGAWHPKRSYAQLVGTSRGQLRRWWAAARWPSLAARSWQLHHVHACFQLASPQPTTSYIIPIPWPTSY